MYCSMCPDGSESCWGCWDWDGDDLSLSFGDLDEMGSGILI